MINAVPEGKGTNLKVALEHLNSMISKRAIVFLISDFQDSGYDQILKTVAKKHDLICVVLEDNREIALPKLGLIDLVDPETGIKATVNSSSPEFRNNFLKNGRWRGKKIVKPLKLTGLKLEQGRVILNL